MAATLNSIVNKRAKLTIPLDKDDPDAGTVTIVYKPKAITQRNTTAFLEEVASSVDQGAAAMVKRFCQVIVEWDLRWDATDPEPIAITPESIADVPVDIIRGIFEAINEDQRPDPQTASA